MSEIYLDIETIPSQEPWVKDHFAKYVKPPANIKKQETLDAWHADKYDEALEAKLEKTVFNGETNHIVCIGAAIGDGDIVSFSCENVKDEASMMRDFYQWLEINTDSMGRVFVGHNITQFDMRVIRQRSIILGIKPPKMPFDAKPWDLNPYDTMIQWNSKDYVKQSLLAKALGIEKDTDVDGSQVYEMWRAGKHEEIATYCRNDVRLVREIYKRMKYIGA